MYTPPKSSTESSVVGYSALCFGLRFDVHLLRLFPGQNRLLDTESKITRHTSPNRGSVGPLKKRPFVWKM